MLATRAPAVNSATEAMKQLPSWTPSKPMGEFSTVLGRSDSTSDYNGRSSGDGSGRFPSQ